MQNQAFHFEIEDLITQFIAAFDDCVIKRFTGSREQKDQISVRYVYAPKQRVIYDIINKGKNLTLPVVSISISQIARDSTRVFNKLDGFYYPAANTNNEYAAFSNQVLSPVPVNISVNMSIIGKYQTDIEQILSNFAAYTNPYLVISWKIPAAYNLTKTYEIRTEVDWSGSIALNYPGDQTPADNYRVTADTNFTIKGWLFPQAPSSPVKNIFFIDANFYATSQLSGNPHRMLYSTLEDYATLSASNIAGVVETISISAAPTITNIYYANGGAGIGQQLSAGYTLNTFNSGGIITLLGKRFQYTTHVGLCSNNINSFYGTLTSFNFAYYPTISCYLLDNFTIVNENIISFRMPTLTAYGTFNFVIIDEAGYDTTFSVNGSSFSYVAAPSAAPENTYIFLDDSLTILQLDQDDVLLQLT